MIDRLLVMVVGMILMTAISVQLLLFSLPLFRRIEFDAVCHQYTLLMDQCGGLTGTATANLVQTLQERRFTVTSVQAPGQAAYGDMMTLIVQATITDWRLTGTLQMEEVNTCFVYEASIVCRILQAGDTGP